MRIALIRHGKTKGNLEGRYVGSTDEPLDALGIKGLEGSDWSRFAPELVYTSPMLRCRQTAEILFGDEAPQRVCQGLEEIYFGRFEYKNYQELNGDPDYQAWIDSGGTLDFPEGESLSDFKKRNVDAFARCIREAMKEGRKRIAFVVHGGTIMAVMEQYGRPKQDYYSWQVRNGQGFETELRWEEEQWYMESSCHREMV